MCNLMPFDFLKIYFAFYILFSKYFRLFSIFIFCIYIHYNLGFSLTQDYIFPKEIL